MISFNFAEWLKNEMTSCASVGGGTSTADVANFSRPLFSSPVRRGNSDKVEHKKKKKHKKKH
jgi:hypothetical protein